MPKYNNDREQFDAWVKKLNIEYDDMEELFEIYSYDMNYKRERNQLPNIKDFFETIMDMIKYNDYPLNLKDRFIKFKNTNSCVRSLERFTLHYGMKLGTEKFDSYREKQAKSNTFEYKRDKYGWTREQFDEYNASRAVTLENMIKRHGKEEGTKKFKAYCKRQEYAGVKLEYFIEKYGEKEGKIKYQEMLDAKLQPVLSSKMVSKQESECIMLLETKGIEFVKEQAINHIVDEDNIEYQYHIFDNNLYKNVFYDACCKDKKILIEYNGDIWHQNKRAKTYKRLENNGSELLLGILNRSENDKIKKEIAEKAGFSLFVIWEMDWKYHKEEIIDFFLNWYKNPTTYFSTEELYPNESH